MMCKEQRRALMPKSTEIIDAFRSFELCAIHATEAGHEVRWSK